MQSTITKRVNRLQTYKLHESEEAVYVNRDEVLKIIDKYTLPITEVKKEADRYGYILVKRNYNKLIPCICGCDKRRRVQKDNQYYIECKNCERYVSGKTVVDAVNKWNDMMRSLNYKHSNKPHTEEAKARIGKTRQQTWLKQREAELQMESLIQEEENEPESRETV